MLGAQQGKPASCRSLEEIWVGDSSLSLERKRNRGLCPITRARGKEKYQKREEKLSNTLNHIKKTNFLQETLFGLRVLTCQTEFPIEYLPLRGFDLLPLSS